MALFGLFGGTDINQGVEQQRATPGAILLDVRERDEYARGRIPGSVNLPLSEISAIAGVTGDKNQPLFVYCLSGGRSRSAASALESMGYKNVTNIGGINRWKGEIEG